MRIHRGVAGAVAAGAVLLGVPAAAQATAGTIVVKSVGSPPASAGSLFVRLQATTPVVASSISASIYGGSGSQPVLTVSDFTLTGGSNAGGKVTTWTVATPIKQAQLPLGRYTVAVTASDKGGDRADVPDAGTFAFVIYPAVTLTVTPSTFSYGQSVTLSGTDKGLSPDGSTAPLAGQPIDLLDMTLATDASGAFSATVQAGVGVLGSELAAASQTAFASADATTAAASSNSVKTAVVPVQVRITGLTVSPAVVSYPGSFALTGVVSVQSGSQFEPYAGAPLTVTSVGGSLNRVVNPGFAGITVTTGADGSFRAVIPGPIGPDQFTFQPGSDVPPWYSGLAPLTVPVLHVPLRSAITATAAGRGRVRLQGCLGPDVPAATDLYPPAMGKYPAVRIQAARSRRGPWTTVATVRRATGPPQHVAHCFAVTVRTRGKRGYVRLVTSRTSFYLAFTGPAIKVAAAVR